MKAQNYYRYSTPHFINKSLDWSDKEINLLLEKTMLLLGKLDVYANTSCFSDEIENIFKIRETVSSNKIVGIESSYLHYFTPSKTEVAEKLVIQNHFDAINWGVSELKKYPLSIRLIKTSHKMLFAKLDNKNKNPGRTRDSLKNYLSDFSADYEYVPPAKEELKNLILDARKFWNNDKLKIPQIIKFAISLYQFENLLPFVAGNGRTARLLTSFQFISVGFLSRPVLNMSVYFEEHKNLYYKLINEVRKELNIEMWIKFFLTGVQEMATDAIDIYKNVEILNSKYTNLINEKIGIKRKVNAVKLFNFLFKTPFINTMVAAEALGVTFQTANTIINELVQLNILYERDNYKRNRVFYFKDLIELFWEK